jgi:hypothetical protein
MTPEELLNLVAERAALGNLQDEDDPNFGDLDEIDSRILDAAPDIARALIEARLTLAAERGLSEGAPDPAWTFCDIWRREYANGEYGMVFRDGTWLRGRLAGNRVARRDKADNQRAAMIAADQSTP